MRKQLGGVVVSCASGMKGQGKKRPPWRIFAVDSHMVVPSGELSHTHETGMGLAVVAIPEPLLLSLLGEVAKGISHELDGSCGVGDEDDVEVGRVRAEKAKYLKPHIVDHVT